MTYSVAATCPYCKTVRRFGVEMTVLELPMTVRHRVRCGCSESCGQEFDLDIRVNYVTQASKLGEAVEAEQSDSSSLPPPPLPGLPECPTGGGVPLG